MTSKHTHSHSLTHSHITYIVNEQQAFELQHPISSVCVQSVIVLISILEIHMQLQMKVKDVPKLFHFYYMQPPPSQTSRLPAGAREREKREKPARCSMPFAEGGILI